MAGLDAKYRPRKLEEVIGQVELVRAIRSTIGREDKEMPHTFLLHGERGCGKTTLARIMARMLGANGRDIKEINIADMRGIDTARQIITAVKFAPLQSDKKILILNECHMATKEFQNSMLEILEEPPPHVYFILGTTNPERLIPTVLSRCALRRFKVKPLSRGDMKMMVLMVLESEGRNWPKEAVSKIVKMSGGIPREALLLLDSVIDTKPDKIETALDRVVLAKEAPVELARAISRKIKWKEVAELLKTIDGEPEEIRRVVLEYLRMVLLDHPNDRVAFAMMCFATPVYDSGRAGLALAAYKAVHMIQ